MQYNSVVGQHWTINPFIMRNLPNYADHYYSVAGEKVKVGP